jgi:hypothetical protein
MTLSAFEQQALDSIKDGLADSDPTLVARLAMFTRLVSAEEMPARETIQAGARRPSPRPGSRPGLARRACQRLGFQRAALLLWLVTTVALIAVALVFSREGGQGTCTGPTGSWATLCTGAGAASAPKSASPIP